MSSHIIVRPLSVCTYCNLFLANDKTGYGPATDKRVADALYEVWGARLFALEADGEELGHSDTACQGCESAPAGKRFKAGILTAAV